MLAGAAARGGYANPDSRADGAAYGEADRYPSGNIDVDVDTDCDPTSDEYVDAESDAHGDSDDQPDHGGSWVRPWFTGE